MQNQNVHSWAWGQGPAPPFTGGQPMLPTNFPPPGVDQNHLLSGYQQMYGGMPNQQPPDYSQWTTAQLQQWQQWQQWQEKYQQWQAQYGKKYAESLAAIGQNPAIIMPGMPPVLGVPKPVDPASSVTSNPPLPSNSQPVPPPPPDEEKPPLPPATTKEGVDASKSSQSSTQDNPEELSEAEKTFDIQFKQWEGQFNDWKKQNQDHPDKVQYREYEKKWETWREQLLQRREQMRKKRLSKSSDPSADSNITVNKTVDDSNAKSVPTGVPAPEASPSKSTDLEYSYKSQIQPPPTHPSFIAEPPNLENKVPFFDKTIPPLGPPPLDPFNVRSNSAVDKNSSQPSPNNFGATFGGDKIDMNRQAPYPSKQNFQRNPQMFGSPVAGFSNNQDKGLNIGSNPRFGSFEGTEGNINSKLRNPNFEGPRMGGNFDGFPPRQRFGNENRNFGGPQRFPGDNFRNERDFGSQRLFDNPRDKESHNYGDSGRGNDINDFRQGNCPPSLQQMQNPPPKPKVPSLFDITVEKPLSLGGQNNDRKPKIWEKDFNDPFDKRQDHREQERNDHGQPNNLWGNNNSPWGKNAPSPWIQPWEMEKLASQKPPDLRGWDSDNKKDIRPWIQDLPGKPEIDKAELSGYVGNILAKLGNFNVMPPNVLKPEGMQDGGGLNTQNEFNQSGDWNKGTSLRNKEDIQNNMSSIQSAEGVFRGDNRDPHSRDFGGPGPRDFDERGSDFNNRLRDGSLGPTNFDLIGDQRKDSANRSQFDNEGKGFDIDERMTPGRDDRGPFRRDDTRNFSRGRDDRRNFGNDDRFFNRDDRPFGRPERGLNKFNSRNDMDDRLGGRNGRRGFDRFDRDDRDSRFFDRSGPPFDRFGRGRDQSVNEPVWNPQVFDYSKGRPQKLSEDDGFKISTVVDYSHGENKKTFDYGHGEAGCDRPEGSAFDYGHKTEGPTVIDYGHGVDRDPSSKDCKRGQEDGNVDERFKNNSGTQSPIMRRSRSPRRRLRSHSRSPHSKFKRSSKSPPFRGQRGNRDRLGRPLFKRDRNGSEDKLSPADSEVSKHSFDVTTVLVEDLICLPGRETRPNKLVFIMRGIPGSGKTYVTKLIKDKEIELGGDPPRILSLDDYFMTEVEKEIVDKETGRKIKTKVLEYEYEAGVEPHYRGSLLKAFKKTVSDGFFCFIIVDSVNEKTKDYEEMWSFAKQKGFQVYIAEMDNDVTVCKGRNIHKRTEKEISDLAKAWEETPPHFLRLDVRSLLQSDAITEVEMEVISDTELEKVVPKEDEGGEKENDEEKNDKEDEKDEKEDEEEDEPGVSAFVKSRWDQFENSEQNLDRLDGLKKRREGFHTTMEDYLQLPDDLDVQVNSEAVPGKKRVRWADLEERKQQEKMRAIGFVVGQTDWSRMTDPTFGESALTRTKYI